MAVAGEFAAPAELVDSPRPGAPRLTHRQVAGLQRLAGNRVTTRAITRQIQRHTEGTELPNKEDQVSEVAEKGQAAPEATRTKAEETTQVGEATKSGKAFQKAQKLTPGAMSLASAEKILQGAFGAVKKIVPGAVVVLADQPACAAKYDEVCMADGLLRPDGVTPWAAGDCAKDDAAAGVLTQGFAWKGVAYVNGKTTLVTATTHEILHNNVGAGFRTKMGETFNEGTTELLARRALSVAGVTVPSVTAYPDQVKFTVRLQKLMGEKILTDAYFGGPDALIAKFEELKGVGTWAALKVHAEALDEAKFNASLAAKKGK
ncbi:MAG: hypothetical protein ABI782_05830 [Anaerolineaceae bacterium]